MGISLLSGLTALLSSNNWGNGSQLLQGALNRKGPHYVENLLLMELMEESGLGSIAVEVVVNIAAPADAPPAILRRRPPWQGP